MVNPTLTITIRIINLYPVTCIEVGSEPKVENLRLDTNEQGVEGELAEISSEDIPNLTPGTCSSDENEEEIWNFKGGLVDGKMVDLTLDTEFKTPKLRAVDILDGNLSRIHHNRYETCYY